MPELLNTIEPGFEPECTFDGRDDLDNLCFRSEDGELFFTSDDFGGFDFGPDFDQDRLFTFERDLNGLTFFEGPRF